MFNDQLFYSSRISLDILYLDEQEASHCTAVLRKKTGDTLSVTDGKGNLYHCKIKNIKKGEVETQIIQKEFFEKKEQLILAVSPTKNRERLEWMTEKLVEIGVKEIILMYTERTERSRINTLRLEKKALSAMKQSLRYYKPEIKEMEFEEVLKIEKDQKFIAHCFENIAKTRPGLLGEALVLIGPEGDFSDVELNKAMSKNFQGLDLGDFRLRTETAAIVVASLGFSS